MTEWTEIGAGARSVVYSVKMGSAHLAVKVPRHGHEHAIERELLVHSRIRREMSAAPIVKCLGFVSVCDEGASLLPQGCDAPPGRIGLVMEFLDGFTLCDHMGDHMLSDESIDVVVRDVYYGLGALHRMGFVHTDLSVRNVMVLLREDRSVHRAVIIDMDAAKPIGFELDDRWVEGRDLYDYNRPRAKVMSPAVDLYAMSVLMDKMFRKTAR